MAKTFVPEKLVLKGPNKQKLEAKLPPAPPQDESPEDHFLEEAPSIIEKMLEDAGIMAKVDEYCGSDSYKWDILHGDIPCMLYAQKDVDIFEDKQWILAAEGTMRKC